jgi:threonine/homoserine/homoserine lactone efflux protein
MLDWPLERLTALATLAFATTITPGPNNLMLMASGLNFGVRRSAPAWIGVNLGFVALTLGVGLGLGALLGRWPTLDLGLRIGSGLVVAWMAWKLARSGAALEGQAPLRPVRLWEAAAFQWINPKAWLMAVSAVATYARPDGFWTSLALIVAAFTLVGSPCNGSWVVFGARLRRHLAAPGRRKIFNLVMAGLLLASVLPMLLR